MIEAHTLWLESRFLMILIQTHYLDRCSFFFFISNFVYASQKWLNRDQLCKWKVEKESQLFKNLNSWLPSFYAFKIILFYPQVVSNYLKSFPLLFFNLYFSLIFLKSAHTHFPGVGRAFFNSVFAFFVLMFYYIILPMSAYSNDIQNINRTH